VVIVDERLVGAAVVDGDIADGGRALEPRDFLESEGAPGELGEVAALDRVAPWRGAHGRLDPLRGLDHVVGKADVRVDGVPRFGGREIPIEIEGDRAETEGERRERVTERPRERVVPVLGGQRRSRWDRSEDPA
jgi:hypothetical protein